jgi:Predicted glycosyltransferases
MPATGNLQDGVSVVICCYNSEKVIARALECIARQQITNIPEWEVVLVNNNSKDNTVAVAEAVQQQYGSALPLRIINEPQQGLMYARHTGIASTFYDITLFCDDDNFLDQHYMQTAYDVMRANPEIGIVGGQTSGAYASAPPEWFHKISSGYAIGQQQERSGDVTHTTGQVWGAGMVSRTTLLRDIFKEEFITTGRKGGKLAAGDDTELCYKAILRGYKIYYDERLKLQHFITPQRLTWEYAIRLNKGLATVLPNLLGLRRLAVEKKNETIVMRLKDFLFAIKHNFKLQYLLHWGRIRNLEKHEGDFELWDAYFRLNYIQLMFTRLFK